MEKTTRRGFLGVVAAIAAAPAAAMELLKSKPKPEEYSYTISAPCDENGWLQYKNNRGDDIALYDIVEISGPADLNSAMIDKSITVSFRGDGARLAHCAHDGLLHFMEIHLHYRGTGTLTIGTVVSFDAYIVNLAVLPDGISELNLEVSGEVTWNRDDPSNMVVDCG